MKRRLYPAVLERGRKGAFGAWFPDFPGCVAAGKSQEETIEKAEDKLAQAVDVLFEQGRPLPVSTSIERIVLPKGCDLLAYFVVGVDPPDPSARRGTRHEPLQLFRARRRLGVDPAAGPVLAGGGGAPLEGAQDGWAANEKILDQKIAGVTGWPLKRHRSCARQNFRLYQNSCNGASAPPPGRKSNPRWRRRPHGR